MASKLIAVIGLGTFGYELCLELTKKGSKVIAMDKDQKLLEKIKEEIYQTIEIDATDEIAMKSTPISSVDTAVVAMASDIQSSILSTAILKNFNISHVIARSSSAIHHQILSKIGADEIINIEVEQGRRIANKIVSPNLIDQYTISDRYSFAEIVTPEPFINKTLPALDLRNKHNVSVVLIKRKDFNMDEFGNTTLKEIVIIPDAHETLKEGDILILVGEDISIKLIKEL